MLSREQILEHSVSDTMLTREQILGSGFRSKVVGTRIGKARVRVMSGAARELFERSINEAAADCTVRARWMRMTVCYESGELMFTDDDIPVLAQLDYDILMPIFTEALRINGMAPESVEQAEKN